MIECQKYFDQPIRNETKTNNNIGNISTGQGGSYKTGCSLDYPYFKENYVLSVIAIELTNPSKTFMLIQKQYNKLISQEI